MTSNQPQPPQTPIQLTIPPALTPLTIPLQTYLTTHTHAAGGNYTNLALGALIFHPRNPIPTTPTHLLLLRRAPTELAFPLLWEVPGGSCEASDPTILHSLAREVFEETGLRLCKFVRGVGGGVEFATPRREGEEGEGEGERRWLKLSFEVEVLEVHGGGGGGRTCGASCQHEDWEKGVGDRKEGVDVEIRLDPEEHQGYVWATEEDIRGDRYPIVTPEQKEVMLEGFALRKGDSERVKALIDRSQKGS